MTEINKARLIQQAGELQKALTELHEEALFIEEATPVLWLGRSQSQSIITVGINPSPRDFLTREGQILPEQKRRFALKKAEEPITAWLTSEENQQKMLDSFEAYFERNTAYSGWFGKPEGSKLEGFMNEWGLSYYRKKDKLLHMDFLPVATVKQAGRLKQKSELLMHSKTKDFFAERIKYMQPKSLIFLGKEFYPLLAEAENSSPWRYNPDFPSAGYSFGFYEGIPSAVLSFKPSEQFLGLGGKEDIYGQNHGFYGKKESIRFISFAISQEMRAYFKQDI